IRGLGIDRHPELEPMYFANYRRLVFLSQTEDPALLALARAAADRLGLAFEHRHVGMGELAGSIAAFASGDPVRARAASTGDHLAADARSSPGRAGETDGADRAASRSRQSALRLAPSARTASKRT